MLRKEREEKEREHARAESARADVAQAVQQNVYLRMLAKQEEQRRHSTEGLRNSLSDAGRGVRTHERNLAATVEHISWHCELDGTPGLGAPGESYLRVGS